MELSTSPDSGFVKYLVVQRRDATGVDSLRGLSLRRIGAGAGASTLESQSELIEVLVDRFGLDLSPVVPEARATLWAKVHRAHEQWEAAGRP